MMRAIAILMLCLSVAAHAGEWVERGQTLMVRPDGSLSPTNAAAEVSSLAAIAAQSVANAQAASLLAQGLSNTTAKADVFDATLAALEGTIWIRSFNVLSIGESVAPDTNITATIIKFDDRYGHDETMWSNRVYTFFSADPGYDPITRIGQSLAGTNLWEEATIYASYHTNIVVGETSYEDVSVTEFGVPLAWSQALARVACEVRGAGTNQTNFRVNNGIEVRGETPLTLIATYGTNQIRIIGGNACRPPQ
ncbi:MAG: hypothetical protein PHR35_12590 [Kiritimatiellae bacterium]|nr:hypothetical protein [Kiritimatiellia bacterium]